MSPALHVLLALTVVAVTARTATAQFPQGIYVSPDALDPHAISRYAGVEIHLIDGRYEMRRDGELRVSGRYVATDNEVSITDEQGAWACPSRTATATFSWRRNGDSLFLASVGEDPCNRRRNRLSGATLVKGNAPALPPVVNVLHELRESWETFWLKSEASGWVDSVFAPDAIAEDGNRKLSGIAQIRQWLGGQDSRDPQPFPFEFSGAGDRVVEKGRYRDVFASPDGSTRVLVGRYQITWRRVHDSKWVVQEWILR